MMRHFDKALSQRVRKKTTKLFKGATIQGNTVYMLQ